MAHIDWTGELAFASQLADIARPIALTYFRTGLRAEGKPAAEFDPVTAADREIEAAMRRYLATHRPEDGVLGEEEAPKTSQNGRTWVLDPIDGTRAFIAGAPTWCVLIALYDETGPVLSVIDQPFTGERFLGVHQHQTWWEHAGERRVLDCRAGAETLDHALIATTDLGLFTPDEALAFSTLAGQARIRRYGLDCYAYAALALGGIDLVVESGLKIWDVGALIPVVTGAGGVITNWRGGPGHQGGQVLAAATPDLHAQAMQILEPAAL